MNKIISITHINKVDYDHITILVMSNGRQHTKIITFSHMVRILHTLRRHGYYIHTKFTILDCGICMCYAVNTTTNQIEGRS